MDGYQRRKQQKKDSIRRAALELFTIHGTKKISIAEIAEKAGANPVTIYNHFGGKEGLVREVIKSLIENHWAKYRKILESELPFLKKMEQIIISKTEMAKLYNSELLYSALAEDPDVREMIESLYKNEVNPLFTKFIQGGQEKGFIRSDLSIGTITVYIDMFTDLARSHPQLFSDQERLVNFTREIWSVFLYGLIGKKTNHVSE